MYNYIQFHGTKYKITLVPCVYYDSLTLKVTFLNVTFATFVSDAYEDVRHRTCRKNSLLYCLVKF